MVMNYKLKKRSTVLCIVLSFIFLAGSSYQIKDRNVDKKRDSIAYLALLNKIKLQHDSISKIYNTSTGLEKKNV